MLKAENISRSFGADRLFDTISFNINPGEKIGLVGRNGHGKTTLLRLITGEEQSDTGQIIIPRGYRVGYLTQHLNFTQSTVLEEGCLGLPEYQQNEIWLVEKILAGLGFTGADLKRAPADFSGGFQVRLNLAKVLVSDPNLLLLDEPTNFLDVISIRWLSSFLKQWPGELLLVTHDQSFMDKVITHTLGIHRRKIQKIPGNSDKYYQQLALNEEVYEKTRLNEEKKRKETEIFISRFRAKARLANMVQSRIKTLAKQDPDQRLEKIKKLNFSFSYEPSPAKLALQVDQISFSYEADKPLIEDFSVAVRKNDRIGVVGKNGSGKTTLLRILAGELPPDKGSCLAHNLTKTGYYAQTNRILLNDSLTVEEEIMNAGCQRQQARDICGAMMFTGDQALKSVSVLSGGEKSRVLLGRILGSPANLLLLDEPSNHLDIDSCRAFLEAIVRFPGAVVLVTHNELFLHSLANRLIVFQDDGVSLFEGSYDEFLNQGGWKDEATPGNSQEPQQQLSELEGETAVSKKELRKLRADILSSRSRAISPIKKKISEIELAIADREATASSLNDEMVAASEAGQGDLIAEVSRRYHDIQPEIESLYEQLEILFDDLEEKKSAYDKQLEYL